MNTDQNPIGCTRAIAEYVARTQFADLPRAAVATTKLHILDALGIMLGAYGTRHALIRGLIELTLEQSARAVKLPSSAQVKKSAAPTQRW